MIIAFVWDSDYSKVITEIQLFLDFRELYIVPECIC